MINKTIPIAFLNYYLSETKIYSVSWRYATYKAIKQAEEPVNKTEIFKQIANEFFIHWKTVSKEYYNTITKYNEI